MISELKPTKAIVDCPSINLVSYKNYSMNQLTCKPELIVEHKADMNYLAVAAASVIAKVIRDRQVERVKVDIGIDYGSGYMSDPKTQEFLKNYSEEHAILFRKSWKSYKNVEDKKKQKSLEDF